jgi:hypothetical protein
MLHSECSGLIKKVNFEKLSLSKLENLEYIRNLHQKNRMKACLETLTTCIAKCIIRQKYPKITDLKGNFLHLLVFQLR